MAAPAFICTDHDDRPAWLNARRTGLGGSDAPGVMGISPFTTPAKIAAQKSGLLPLDSDEETELMAWGRKVEPLLIECFLEDMEKAGKKGWQAKQSGKLWRCTKPGRHLMLATVDGQAVDPRGRAGVIECKLKIFGADEWDKHGIPDYVVAQTLHNMEVVQAPFGVVIALLSGYRPRWKIIDANGDVLEGSIVPAELAFWEKWEAGEAFPLDVGPAQVNLDLVKSLYPEDLGTTIRLEGQQYVDAARAWRTQAEKRLAAEKAEKKAKVVLSGAIGNHTFAQLDNGSKLSLKTTRKGEVLQKATSYRVLREVAAKKGRR